MVGNQAEQIQARLHLLCLISCYLTNAAIAARNSQSEFLELTCIVEIRKASF